MAWLFAEKWPYVVTLFIGASGWMLTHTTDRLTKTPTIEYSLVFSGEGSNRVATVKITNLADTAIGKPRFMLRKLTRGADVRFAAADMVTGLPAWIGVTKPITTEDAVEFVLDVLPPGARAELTAKFAGRDAPVLQFLMGPESAGTFRFEESGWMTFAVRHELGILWGVLGTWAVGLSLIAAFRRRGT